MKATIYTYMIIFLATTTCLAETVDIGPDTTYCPGECYTIDISTAYPASTYNYAWNFNGELQVDLNESPTITFCPTTTTSVLSLDIMEDEAAGEPQPISDSRTFTLIIPPFGNLTSSTDTVCQDSCLTLTAPSGGNSYSWTPSSALNNDTSESVEACISQNTMFVVTTYTGDVDQCQQNDTIEIYTKSCEDTSDSGDPTSVISKSANNSITTSYNAERQSIIITKLLDNKIYDLRVYNLAGQTERHLLLHPSATKQQISTATLARGVYIISISSDTLSKPIKSKISIY